MNTYTYHLEKNGEYGVVTAVNYPVARVMGLPTVRLNEVVIAETGEMGIIFGIYAEIVEVLLLSKGDVRVGAQFVRTNELISIPVGEELKGWLIDPLGNPLLDAGTFKKLSTNRPLQGEVLGIDKRVRVSEPFHTGVSLVDLVIPLGKGQKELIVGDRKSGKTSFVFNAVCKQAEDGVIVIYAVIGRKKSEIKRLYDNCREKGILKNVIMVATSSDDSPSMIYLTPFTAIAVAEYFRDSGQEVVIILDDLSTHAKFYREISLLAERFPGRESYPGDIFFLHSQLMERVGNFKDAKKGAVAITCLPIVETVEGDLSGYIPTNTMGMTDGHIFFDSNAFYNGRRPGINTSLSVTRVGKQTQSQLTREINHELSSFLIEYEKMLNYSHFGAELSGKVKSILAKGMAIYELFQQQYQESYPHEVQLIAFGLIWSETVMDVAAITAMKPKLLAAFQQPTSQALIAEVLKADTIYALQTNIGVHKDELLKLIA